MSTELDLPERLRSAIKGGCLMVSPSDVAPLLDALHVARVALGKLSYATDETPVRKTAQNALTRIQGVLK